MTSNHLSASDSLIHRESGYGGSDLVRFADFEDEIRSIMRPFPDTSMMRSQAEIRRDEMITETQKIQEIKILMTEQLHFASLKANYRNHPNCEWMEGEQLPNCWVRLGDTKPVTIVVDDFEDALYYDINVISSQLYPEGVAVVVATVPNDGKRKPIQARRTNKKVKVHVRLLDILELKTQILDAEALIR